MVFPLRLLRLKTSDPKLYKQITSLEGHVEHRQDQVSAYDYFSLVRKICFYRVFLVMLWLLIMHQE